MTEEVRTLVLGRYTYTIQHDMDGYHVRCDDTESHRHAEHGPYTLNDAHKMLDAREKREEEREQRYGR
jgi:hypothetical protein